MLKYLYAGAEDLNKETLIVKPVMSFDTQLKNKKLSRKVRSKNTFSVIHSDGEDDLRSMASDNPLLYARSRSSVG